MSNKKINPFLIHKISEILLKTKTTKIPNTDQQAIAEAQAVNIVLMVRKLDN